MNRVQIIEEKGNKENSQTADSKENGTRKKFNPSPNSIYTDFTTKPSFFKAKDSITSASTPKFDVSPMYAEIKKQLKEKTPVTISKAPKVDVKKAEELIEEKQSTGLLGDKLPPPTAKTAHKRYHPVLPCASKLLAKKWDDATWRKHKEKIKTMKACIDNVHTNKLSTLGGLKANVTRQGKSKFTIEKEKKIAKENQILVDRMARTFAHPSVFTNFDEAFERTTKDLEHKSKAYMRKRDIAKEKIDKENKILLERLKSKRPIYESKKWDQEQEEHMRYLMIMTSFPEAYQKKLEKAETASNKSSKSRKSDATATKNEKSKRHVRSKDQVPLPHKYLVKDLDTSTEEPDSKEPTVHRLDDLQNCTIKDIEEESVYPPSSLDIPIVKITVADSKENFESKHDSHDEQYESDFNTTTTKEENSIISSIFITEVPQNDPGPEQKEYNDDAFEFFD
ncbi:hypothetical protein HK103_000695 [Boothiomyces macroporosus]|uniref:Uncharacterized protein n=1 Tax=Boothiomyces macroporosus TaxID=261099 RepID=A0AAD5Y1D8_9FUNG|nr:hypothetical protein HK103_000695 [Boothiomyces macroporosus]